MSYYPEDPKNDGEDVVTALAIIAIAFYILLMFLGT